MLTTTEASSRLTTREQRTTHPLQTHVALRLACHVRARSTFDRIIDGGKSVFVRFDKEYSYGDEHDAWKEFAKSVGESAAEMLVVDVGVSEYGDKDNADLSDRFSIKTDDFPQYRLFLKGVSATGTPEKYTGDKKADAFLRYVQVRTVARARAAAQTLLLHAAAAALTVAGTRRSTPTD